MTINQQTQEYDWLSHSIQRTLGQTNPDELMDAMVLLIKFKQQALQSKSQVNFTVVDRDFSKLMERLMTSSSHQRSILMLNAIYLDLNATNIMKYLQYSFLEQGIRIGEALPLIDQANAPELYVLFKRSRTLCELAHRLGINVSKTLEWINITYSDIKKIPGYDSDTKRETIEEVLRELENMIGLSNVKKEVKELVQWLEFTTLRHQAGLKTSSVTLHSIYSGSPGTGKTTIARLIGRLFKAMNILRKGHVVEVARQDLVAEYVGQTAMKTKKQIDRAMGGLLFIDEAYTLARGQENDFGREAIDTLVKSMEDQRDQFIVILAGYKEEMNGLLKLNPGLESRFSRYFHFSDYDGDELFVIAQNMLKEHQFFLDRQAEEELKLFLEGHQNKGNGRLVRNIVERMMVQKAVKAIEQNHTDLQIITQDIVFKSTVAWSKG